MAPSAVEQARAAQSLGGGVLRGLRPWDRLPARLSLEGLNMTWGCQLGARGQVKGNRRKWTVGPAP